MCIYSVLETKMERKSEDVIASELRIAKRRERIEQQKTLKNKNSKSRNQNGQDGVKLSRGKQQVVDSLGQLDRRKVSVDFYLKECVLYLYFIGS